MSRVWVNNGKKRMLVDAGAELPTGFHLGRGDMSATDGKAKCSEFEREVGRSLSLWLSRGEKDDLTSRTDCSGGRFTAVGKGNPGDLSSSHPLANPFFGHVLVECKHWRWVEWMDFTFQKGELYGAFLKNNKQALSLGKVSLLVVKQNFKPTLVICETLPILNLMSIAHYFNHGLNTVGKFDDFLKLDPDQFLTECRVYLGDRYDERKISEVQEKT